MTSSDQKRFVIIAGAERSGTTSLFEYLGDHPQVCASSIKETRFFLDKTYPVGVRYYYDEGIEKYLEYFSRCASRPVYLEASPQYLYSSGTPERIRLAINDVRLIFILREPVERLKSLYFISIRLGRIAPETSFESWIRPQLDNAKAGISAMEYHMLALEQGEYSRHLPKYLKIFSGKEIAIYQFGQLIHSPHDLLNELCEFVGLSRDPYDDYSFGVHNPSMLPSFKRFNSLYFGIRNAVKEKLTKDRSIYRILRTIYGKIDPAYQKHFMRKTRQLRVSDNMLAELEDYYKNEEDKLGAILGISNFKWK